MVQNAGWLGRCRESRRENLPLCPARKDDYPLFNTYVSCHRLSAP
jgi:hypothetical protein